VTATAKRGRRWRLVRARREAVPDSLRRIRRRPPSWLPGPATGAWLLFGLLVAALLAWVVFNTSLLGVRRVVVTGSLIADADQVRAVAAVRTGTPLVRVDTGAVRARVRRIPSVADADVSRSWPSTLVIEVVERSPVAVVVAGPEYIVLDGQGVVYTTVSSQPKGVVLLRVSHPGPSDPATLAALRVVAALTPGLRDVLLEVVAPTPEQITLRLTRGRTVIWGDADQSDTKANVATALLGRAVTTIDVSSPEVVTTR
jgi:cell division protein FtsQ